MLDFLIDTSAGFIPLKVLFALLGLLALLVGVLLLWARYG